MIEFYILGSLDLRDSSSGNGIQSILAGPKRVAILAYLAVAAPRGLEAREKLLAMFWPEASDTRARNGLNQFVFVLRRGLGQSVLITRGEDEIGLEPAELWCDAVAFDEALDEGRREEALGLYRGDLLDGFYLDDCPAFEHWLEGERNRLRERALEAALFLAREEESVGNLAGALPWYHRARALAPFDESLERLLLGVLQSLGDRTGAIREYEGFEKRLAKELELEPSAETRGLAEAIRSEVPPEPHTAGSLRERASPKDVAGGAGAGANGSVGGTRRVPTLLRFRRRWLVVVGIGVVAFAVVAYANTGWLGSQVPLPAGVQPKLLMITPFANETDTDTTASVAGLGLSASNRVAEALSRSGLVKVVPAAESAHWKQVLVNEGFPREDPSILRAIAERAGAELYVAGSYAQRGDSVHLWARILDVRTGTLLRAIVPVAVLHEAVGKGIGTLQQRITGAVGTVVDPRFEDWSGAASLPSNLESYRRYSVAVDLYIEGRFDAAAAGFLDAAAGDPMFTAPVIWAALARTKEWYGSEHFDDSMRDAAESLVASLGPVRDGLPAWDQAMLRHVEALLHIDYPDAHRTIREVVEVAPAALWYLELAMMCAWLDRPVELLDVLGRFDTNAVWLETSRRRYWSRALWAHHRLGDYDRELEVVRSLRSSPNPGRWLYSVEMRALIALQRDEEVADEFELLVVSDNPFDPGRIRGELMAHGYTELSNRAAARVVEILDGTPATDRDDDWKYFRATFLMNGRTAEAQSLLEEIPADSPRYLDALGFLGELAAKRGEREEALRISAALEAIGQASLRYEYQAIIAAELGDRERAVSLLRQNESPPRGYMHREMGFPTLRDYAPFLELERPRG